MEAKKPRVNNYILYKDNNSWYEGRISNITVEDGKEMYTILSFLTLDEHVLRAEDIMTTPGPELRRKIKSPNPDYIPGRVYIPQTLKNILVVDKEWAKINKYDMPDQKGSAAFLLLKAKEFFIENGLGDVDEVSEIIMGFTDVFNLFITRFLLYNTEKTMYNNANIDVMGPVFLLRLLYYLQKNGHNHVKDSITLDIIHDYVAYLYDYIIMNFHLFF